jgi:hypothetical protein
MNQQWEDAHKLCTFILMYEPFDEIAKQYMPLIEYKLKDDKADRETEEDDENDDDDDEDEDDDDEDDDEEDDDDDDDGWEDDDEDDDDDDLVETAEEKKERLEEYKRLRSRFSFFSFY